MAEMMDAMELVRTLRQNQKGQGRRDSAARRAPADFHDLDGYDQMRLMKAASEEFDLPSPFFRQIDALSGANVQIAGQWCVNFASYDYLGLNGAAPVRAAAQDAIAQWGISANASRLVGGDKQFHADLEGRIADLYRAEAALAMVSGHATNVSTVRCLMGKGDLVLMDALIHNSVAEGVQSSGAAHLTFPHNDWAWIDQRLRDCRDQYRHVLIVTEGLFSMDGDSPDLARFVEVKKRHGAWLMIDEAHALGVLGPTGRGISEAQGVDPGAVDIWMGTLSKTLASCGGYIAGSSVLIDYLRFKSPGFVYSVGLSAPNAAAATIAIDQMIAHPENCARLRENGALFHDLARQARLDIGLAEGHAISPVVIGDSMKTVIASSRLLARGFNVLPILFPAVPEKQARLRYFLTAHHDADQIRDAVAATAEILDDLKTWQFRR